MKKKEQEEQVETNWKDQFLRVTADFQNYKRRTENDRLRWVQAAQVEVLESFLPLLDELNLAIATSEKHEISATLETWVDGFKMIQKNLKTKLEELGVKEIDCSGQFDPNLHEALMQVESAEYKSGDIVAVLSPGYTFKNEVIKHAKVSVAK